MRNRLAVVLVCGTLTAGFAPGLYAQATAQATDDKGWYGGVAVGGARNKFETDTLAIVGSTASSMAKDDTAGAFALAIGYDFSRNWAIEAGYLDYGNFSARRASTAGAVGTANATIDTNAWTLQGIGKFPLENQFYLFGKAGLAQTRTESNISTTGGVALAAGPSTNPKRSKAGFVFGAGIGYDFSRSIGLRLDYTRLSDVGNKETGKGDIDTWTAGLKFRF